MDYIIYLAIGLFMGLFGGLLGIGGSVIMIPTLVFIYGENQHLYQAAAMFCNFFVGISSAIIHKKTNALMFNILKWIVPFALAGVILGVTVSNSSLFAGKDGSYLLTRVYGFFLLYVVIYNVFRLGIAAKNSCSFEVSGVRRSGHLASLCGFITGLSAGLLGIGGGTVCTPTQQLFLKMPFKRAISNSAATFASIALIGAVYKNVTLGQHGIDIMDSIRIAIGIIPGAIVGAIVGSKYLYLFPKNLVRVVFIVVLGLACYKLLTISPGL
ncbi:MAG: sulfite exporter TauE/SafE family protein [Planctomycetota bacterium]|jgi:uncharacterized membrane protein YfcA